LRIDGEITPWLTTSAAKMYVCVSAFVGSRPVLNAAARSVVVLSTFTVATGGVFASAAGTCVPFVSVGALPLVV
jgi:hypothetical protein